MFKDFLKVFTPPDPVNAAQQELVEASLALLEAQSGLEFATAMVDYHNRRVLRLSGFLATEQKAREQPMEAIHE